MADDEIQFDQSHATIETALDLAFERARHDVDETGAFYDALFATVVYLPIRQAFDEDGNESNAQEEARSIEPMVFEVDGNESLLIFDTEDRLARWASEPVNYVGLPGHTFFQMFEGGQQVAVNLAVAPSSVVIPADVVEWLHERAAEAVESEEIAPGTGMDVTPPPELAPESVARITARLAGLRREVHEAILFSLAIDSDEEETIRRVVLGVGLTAAGAGDANSVVEALAETTRGAFDNKRPFEVALLDPESPLMVAARKVGLPLPIVDIGSIH